MIPLRLKSKCNGLFEETILRLNSDSVPTSDFDACLVSASDDELVYSNASTTIRISGSSSADLDGDVLLVNPRNEVAHRLIRARSLHNTFLITERCDQLCVMCSQPPKKHHLDRFRYFEQAALLAPRDARIGISGGEPMLYKSNIFTLFRKCLAARPDLKFHTLTNGQHFENSDRSQLFDLNDNVLWGIPLYSPLQSHHDEIVGKEGAFDRLLKSMVTLARSGAAIELRTVVMRTNIATLPALATLIATKLPFISSWAIMQLENIGFGRANWQRLFFDHSRDFTMIGRAFDIALARGIDARLYNFPLCSIPQTYRAYAPPTISDWKRKYLPICTECAMRDACSGYFEWHPDRSQFEKATS
jgi:His-Xaa-Ser system radical SAM maturase HxsC